jgi:PAS domain S-box-containing protein
MGHSDIQLYKGYSLGAVDYLYKPIIPEILKAKVSTFVDLFNRAEAMKEWEAARTRSAEAVQACLTTIFEATPDLIATATPNGFAQYMNLAGRRLLGIGEEENLGSIRLTDMSSRNQKDLIPREALVHAIRNGVWRGETVLTNPEGKQIPVSQIIHVHKDASGRIEFYSTIVRDMTEQKALEDQLRQAQKLDGIGRLAGGVAHDFNNLLTVILGRSQLLQTKLDVNTSQYRDAQLIHCTGKRAAALTHQLLTFSRKQLRQPRILDLNFILSEMQTMLKRLIPEDIELTTLPAAGLGQVCADPVQIEQVILNLAVNARDAMPEGGKLSMETANVIFDERSVSCRIALDPGPYVMLSVSDTGCGMSEDVQSRIFEPFFTTKDQGQGTGLGLATVYGIVKQSGGTIWVYSEPGAGSIFKIYLPRVDAVPDAVKPIDFQPSIFGGTETILLVEDDRIVREHTWDILSDAGYRVIAAEDSVQAEELCRQEPSIDLLLTDVVMPRMKGPELARRLLSFRPELKVLFVSGYSNSAVEDHGVLDPNEQFLQKPFAADTLLKKVREVLERGQRVDCNG